MATTLPTRQQIDNAQPLDFNQTRGEKQANVTITGTLDGFEIQIEFTGPISSIPAAVERLKTIGLASAARSMSPAPAVSRTSKAARQPVEYNDAGEPCCPVHHRKLTDGQYGLYCSAKARTGDVANPRGYCGLKFEE